MSFSNRENTIYEEIQNWEENLYAYTSTDLAVIYDKVIQSSFALLPDDFKEECATVLDNLLFHLHAIIQGSNLQSEARERILSSARVFNDEIAEIEDLKLLSADQLNYIAEQQMARHRLYSFSQGAVTGMGGAVSFASDIPAITVINLRLVQLIAMSYGYDVNTPKEMMISLKVFHTGTLPNRLQKYGWGDLKQSISETDQSYFYKGDESIVDYTWFEQPLKQIMKYVAISSFKKKKLQGIPLVSMAIGAGSNYALTRRVSEFAHRVYQYRYFQEKNE